MSDYAEPVTRLIEELKHLPSIGQKSAQRIAFHLLKGSSADAERLAQAITEVKQKIGLCSTCNNLTDVDPCFFCSSPTRNPKQICIVEEPANILAVERTRAYHGRYHVLMGALAPLKGVGPDQLRIKNLLERLRGGEVEETILATNPNVEGEATAVYLSKLLKPLGLKVTRIAMGVPIGSELDYADEVTMMKAMEGRREL
jgi:recombination protein RecR